MISITLSRAALDRLDELRGSLPRGTMIAMLIEYWDSKGKRKVPVSTGRRRWK